MRVTDEQIRRLNFHDHWPSHHDWAISLIGDGDLINVGRHMTGKDPYGLALRRRKVERDARTIERISGRNMIALFMRFQHRRSHREIAKALNVSQTRAREIVLKAARMYVSCQRENVLHPEVWDAIKEQLT